MNPFICQSVVNSLSLTAESRKILPLRWLREPNALVEIYYN